MRGRYFASRECLGLHLQVGLRVDVGGVERDMSEPRSYGVEVHAGSQEMCCGRVPDCVRAQPFVDQSRLCFTRLPCITFDEGVNPEARKREAATI